MTYEDCLKEAYEAAEKCRASNKSQLSVNIYEICDEYQDKLKRLCLAHCAKGMLSWNSVTIASESVYSVTFTSLRDICCDICFFWLCCWYLMHFQRLAWNVLRRWRIRWKTVKYFLRRLTVTSTLQPRSAKKQKSPLSSTAATRNVQVII